MRITSCERNYRETFMERKFKTEDAMAASAKLTDREEVRDKILACLYAGALGDALGYAVEFNSYDEIRRRFGEDGIRELELTDGKAVVSDDTQMTLFTAEGLGLGFNRAREKGTASPAEQYVYQAYLCWLRTQGGKASSLWANDSRLLKRPELNVRRAPGLTCLSALGSGKMGTIESPLNNSKGCGGVMRTAPCGFVREKNGTPAFGSPLEIGAGSAAITHGHPLGWIPAGMLSDMIDRCLYGNYGSLTDIVLDSLAAAKELYGEYEDFALLEDLILRAVSLAEKNRKEGADSPKEDHDAICTLGEGWVGEEALAIAVYAALRWDHDMKKCLCAAVNHSGDSDSTGAIAGNILGAYLGLPAVPAEWVSSLELADEMAVIADMMKGAAEL